MNNVSSILIRMKQVLSVKNDKELSKSLDIKYGTIDGWKTRDSIPQKRLKEFADSYNISLNWLLSGAGEMREDENIISFTFFPDIQASAGHGCNNGDAAKQYISYPLEYARDILNLSNLKSIEMILVDGVSMSPTLSDRDVIFVDRDDVEVRSDKVYVYLWEGEVFVKRLLKKLDGTIEIKSDNPSYESEYMDKESFKSITIIGRVVKNMRLEDL